MVGFVRELEIEAEMRVQKDELLRAAKAERPVVVHWSIWQAAYTAGEIHYTYNYQYKKAVAVLPPDSPSHLHDERQATSPVSSNKSQSESGG